MKSKELNPGAVKQAWPTKKAMAQIYEKQLWGGNPSDFYSGEGSHRPELVDPYIEVVTSFLSSFETPPVVCDLGCGDFNVGSKLIAYTSKYIAVDIVEDLITYNKRKFKDECVEFLQLDIATDELPDGDCAVVRQVLQHLSNKEIGAIAYKLKAFKYVIVTEHIPNADFIPNKDIISGQGTRLKKASGVDLLSSPFYLQVKSTKRLLTIPSEDEKSQILTMVFEMY
ncbi:class I SAM-dependent methyltransferase [Psychroflexus montanilacus]|uniref:class I SAM-dependent methyltransferase n=1 Tax=Psychroflexus montanilacus TaxID=2873598 RepID=UPI001CCA6F4C|nr:class I SAM-dependent methyltransferase [Psychroflexus montanilacus]MBZ9652822.1 class I SAM-dependent methyltransferase [Psychroflexus montanilacus]